MSTPSPGLALKLHFPPTFDRLRARTALWSHPGIVGPTDAHGEYLAPQLRGISWTTALYGRVDPFGSGQWIRVISQGDGDTLDMHLDAHDLAAYGLLADTRCEGRARLWWERYLAEVAFAVHARTPITQANTGFVEHRGDVPESGLSLRDNPYAGLEFVERTPPALDTSEVRTLVEKFMCGDASPGQIEASADTLEAVWVQTLGWESLADTHPLARAWEILSVLTSLYDGGVLPEDAPAMLRLLDAAPADAEAEFSHWRDYLRTIDPDARFERMCEIYMPASTD